jgi:hypothetical protein
MVAIFITGREEFGAQGWNAPISLAGRSLVAGRTSTLNNWTFSGEIANIINMSCVRRIEKYLILLVTVGDIGEKALKTIHIFLSQKRRSSILSFCKFWWSETACVDGWSFNLRQKQLQLNLLIVALKICESPSELDDESAFRAPQATKWRRRQSLQSVTI